MKRCVREREREPGGHTDVSSRMNSFDVLVFTDMALGPILYFGTCNHVELGGILEYNISVRAQTYVRALARAHPQVYLSESKLNSLALSFSCFQWQIVLVLGSKSRFTVVENNLAVQL